MKTYSVAFKIQRQTANNGKPYWVTNWNKHASLKDINWPDVWEFADQNPTVVGVGYYYGHNSSALTSSRCRTELSPGEVPTEAIEV